VTDLHELAVAAAVCTPEQLADLRAAIHVPNAPDVRRCVDEMRELESANPHTPLGQAVIALVAVAGFVAGLFT
jgi:hypothetical protein